MIISFEGNRFQKKKWCEKNCGAGIGNTINRQDKMARPAKQDKMARPATGQQEIIMMD